MAAFVRERWGVEVVPQTGWQWLRDLGFRLVVPRTIESSTRITRLPSSTGRFAECFSFTPRCRMWSLGSMKVRPT